MRKLREYMEREALTQTALAGRLGVSQPTVWGWLNGVSMPSAKMLRRLSEETGLSVDELLMEDAA